MNLIRKEVFSDTSLEYGIRELTLEELDEISGGTPIGAAVGAATGAMGYISNSTVSGNFSLGGLAISTGIGAAVGALGPVSAAYAYIAPRAAFYGGYAVGAADGS